MKRSKQYSAFSVWLWVCRLRSGSKVSTVLVSRKPLRSFFYVSDIEVRCLDNYNALGASAFAQQFSSYPITQISGTEGSSEVAQGDKLKSWYLS